MSWRGGFGGGIFCCVDSVSFLHLTLPAERGGWISGGGGSIKEKRKEEEWAGRRDVTALEEN